MGFFPHLQTRSNHNNVLQYCSTSFFSKFMPVLTIFFWVFGYDSSSVSLRRTKTADHLEKSIKGAVNNYFRDNRSLASLHMECYFCLAKFKEMAGSKIWLLCMKVVRSRINIFRALCDSVDFRVYC